jgi:hypothetical protein
MYKIKERLKNQMWVINYFPRLSTPNQASAYNFNNEEKGNNSILMLHRSKLNTLEEMKLGLYDV